MPSLIPYKSHKLNPVEKAKIFFQEHKELAPSIVIVVIFFTAYFIAYFWEAGYIQRLESIQVENGDIAAALSRQRLDDVEKFALKTRMVGTALDDKNHISNILLELESTMHKQVVLDSLSLDAKSNEIKITGFTLSLETLGQQFLLWKNESRYINEIEITSFERVPDSSSISFEAEIRINPDYLKKNNE